MICPPFSNQYGGATSSRGVYAFNIRPYRVYPPDTAEQIGRRTHVRMDMLFQQFNSAAN